MISGRSAGFGLRRVLRGLTLLFLALVVTGALGEFGTSGSTSHSPVVPLSAAALASPPTPAARIPTPALPGLAGVHAEVGAINPLSGGYAHEPAPMGIADFGVNGTGTGARAYTYATESFEGIATVGSMTMTTTSTTPIVTAFELNAMLVLRWNGVNYTYWIQNGLHVDSGTREFTIGGAYVWNFSAPGAHLSGSELSGNRSSVLAADTYYFIPGCGVFAGQCSYLSWPGTFEGRIDSLSVGGVPEVQYQYNLGGGWVTYDTVSFLHLGGATVDGFVVDGFRSTPYAAGLFYDAEWDWVAAGGGSSGRDQGSSLDLSLEYWNGHNYEATPGAWNFGGDTGETSANITDTFGPAAPTGAPAVQIASGAGGLGEIYTGATVGTVDVEVPVANGTLLLNGAAVPFVGGGANFTLDPGSYTIALQNYSNASATFELAAGETFVVDFTGAGRTDFMEAGLPAGTFWAITVDGVTRNGTGTTLSFELPNGTYGVTYLALDGFQRTPTDPVSVTVPAGGPISVAWVPFTYPVSVTETGLPLGTSWWLNASSALYRSTGTTITFPAPNGSTAFRAGASYDFSPPSPGTVTVVGGLSAGAEVTFVYRPTFIVGTVEPAGARIVIGGNLQSVVAGAFNDSVIPGNYELDASATGFVNRTIEVNATAGNLTVIDVVLNATPNVPGPSGSTASGGSNEWLLIGGAGAGIAVVAIAVVLLLRRRATR